MAGWGTGGYGTSPWGGSGGTPAPFSVAYAWAAGDRVVRVVLAAEPKHVNSLNPGDALNPASWQVFDAATSTSRYPMSVSMVDPLTYDVLVFAPFVRAPDAMTVACPGLVSAAGFAIVAPTSASFTGAVRSNQATDEAKLALQKRSVSDLHNPPTPNSPVGGTMQIIGGDYALESGADFVKKMIARRLLTPKGGFFHLPDYGVGLAVKEPIPAGGDLARLRADIERQCALEPEVDTVKAALQYSPASGALVVQIRGTLRKTGQSFGLGLKLPGSVQL